MKYLLLMFAVIFSMNAGAEDIQLPPPVKKGGMPLMEALANRKTTRTFAEKELPLQMISDLLWAANGISREDGRRTVPTALNRQELELGILLPQGTFLYDAQANKLILRSKEPNKGPVLVAIIWNKQKQAKQEFAFVDAGFIGQNIYLFAASKGLNSVFRGSFDRKAIPGKLKLQNDQEVIFVHAIGFPK